MKSSEYLKTARAKNAEQLRDELVALRKEQFNLRIQQSLGQQTKSHLVREVRKNVARVKTLIQQQAKAS